MPDTSRSSASSTLSTPIILYLHGYRDDFSVGECYRQGLHVPEDRERALLYYRRATQRGKAKAKAYFQLGQCYEDSDKTDRIDQAVKAYWHAAIRSHYNAEEHLRCLAELGHVTAEYALGALLEYQQRWGAAELWYERAAEKQHGLAMYRLGKLYHTDRQSTTSRYTAATKENVPEAALDWYRKAAAACSKEALNALLTLAPSEAKAAWHMAQLYELGEGGLAKNMRRALEYYEKSSAQGGGDAAFRLGQYYEGSDGGQLATEKNTQTAFTYYAIAMRAHHVDAAAHLESLAHAGNAQAQYALGFSYYHHQDHLLEAAQWCMKAAEQQHEAALAYLMQTPWTVDLCLKIASLYESGQGVAKNMSQAFVFYKKASDLGDAGAAFRLGQLLQVGHQGVEKDSEQACRYYLQSAESGHPEALAPLARLAETVNASLQVAVGDMYRAAPFNDHSQATVWYRRALEAGDPVAQQRLTVLQKLRSPGQNPHFFQLTAALPQPIEGKDHQISRSYEI